VCPTLISLHSIVCCSTWTLIRAESRVRNILTLCSVHMFTLHSSHCANWRKPKRSYCSPQHSNSQLNQSKKSIGAFNLIPLFSLTLFLFDFIVYAKPKWSGASKSNRVYFCLSVPFVWACAVGLSLLITDHYPSISPISRVLWTEPQI
jgi:hypothetical protein